MNFVSQRQNVIEKPIITVHLDDKIVVDRYVGNTISANLWRIFFCWATGMPGYTASDNHHPDDDVENYTAYQQTKNIIACGDTSDLGDKGDRLRPITSVGSRYAHFGGFHRAHQDAAYYGEATEDLMSGISILNRTATGSRAWNGYRAILPFYHPDEHYAGLFHCKHHPTTLQTCERVSKDRYKVVFTRQFDNTLYKTGPNNTGAQGDIMFKSVAWMLNTQQLAYAGGGSYPDMPHYIILEQTTIDSNGITIPVNASITVTMEWQFSLGNSDQAYPKRIWNGEWA